MTNQDKALETQLNNIQEKTNRSLQDLFAFIQQSGLEKHGQIRDHLKKELGLGHGDANTLTHIYLRKDEEEAPLEKLVDEIYSGAKIDLRPIHDRFMERVEGFGPFEIAPKKGYLSLRRKKQFAMIGPATNTRVEVGINAQNLAGGERLIENKPGSMSQYKVKLTELDQVDDELINWVRQAYESAV